MQYSYIKLIKNKLHFLLLDRSNLLPKKTVMLRVETVV